MLYLDPPSSGTLDRVIDMVPDLIDKVRDMTKKPEEKDPKIVY